MNKKLTLGVALATAAGVALWWGSGASGKKNARAARAEAPTELAAPALTTRTRVAPAAIVPASVAPAAARPAGPAFTAAWGSGPDQLGRERPEEANPMGPMSFAANAKGRVVVLDNVNDRLVLKSEDGRTERTVTLGGGYPEDVAMGDDGSMAVLDRHREKAVSVFDENGQPAGKLPLVGDGIDDPGSVTGIVIDGDTVYAERAHSALVKLGTTKGQPATDRSEIPGRPSRDGLSFLRAGIVDAATGRAYVVSTQRSPEQHRYTRELRLEAPLRQIVLLDTDRSGVVAFGAEVETAGGQTEIRIVCMEPAQGVPIGTATVPANTLPEESLRDFVALPSGGVMYALRTTQGVSYSVVECQ